MCLPFQAESICFGKIKFTYADLRPQTCLSKLFNSYSCPVNLQKPEITVRLLLCVGFGCGEDNYRRLKENILKQLSSFNSSIKEKGTYTDAELLFILFVMHSLVEARQARCELRGRRTREEPGRNFRLVYSLLAGAGVIAADRTQDNCTNSPG